MVKNEPIRQFENGMEIGNDHVITPESPDQIKIELIDAESSAESSNFTELDMQQILPQETFLQSATIEEINNVS